jgi:hypothetical protein
MELWSRPTSRFAGRRTVKTQPTLNAVTRADVRDFIADQLQRWKPATALNRYRSL